MVLIHDELERIDCSKMQAEAVLYLRSVKLRGISIISISGARFPPDFDSPVSVRGVNQSASKGEMRICLIGVD